MQFPTGREVYRGKAFRCNGIHYTGRDGTLDIICNCIQPNFTSVQGRVAFGLVDYANPNYLQTVTDRLANQE